MTSQEQTTENDVLIMYFSAANLNDVDATSYKTVFLGYPVWWYRMPMVLETLFDTYDFSGVTIIPFNTHEGSRDGGTYDMIRNREPGATVLDGIAIRGGKTGDSSAQGYDLD